MRAQVHVGGIYPDEEGLAGLALALDEVHGARGDVVVDRLHALLRQRTRVLAYLAADPAEARVDGRVVLVRRLAIEHAARSVLGAVSRILRIVGELGLFFSVQVVEVAVELVEAVDRWQELIAIAE